LTFAIGVPKALSRSYKMLVEVLQCLGLLVLLAFLMAFLFAGLLWACSEDIKQRRADQQGTNNFARRWNEMVR
jgi:hypothetical protein